VLNRVSGVYLDVADSISTQFTPPDDYHQAHTRFLDALDRGDGDEACAIISDYLDRHDRALTSALEVFA
jgi:hypothetical protein